MARKKATDKKTKKAIDAHKVNPDEIKVPSAPKIEETEGVKENVVKVEVTDDNGDTVKAEIVEKTDVPPANAEDLLQEAKTLKEQVESSYFQLGEVLVKIRDAKAYTVKGYDTFEDWIDEELAFQPSKARALMRVVRFAHDKLPEYVDTIRKMGWSKADVLVRIAKIEIPDKEEIEKLAGLSYRGLKAVYENLVVEEQENAVEILESLEAPKPAQVSAKGGVTDTEGHDPTEVVKSDSGANDGDPAPFMDEGKASIRKKGAMYKVVFEFDPEAASAYKLAIAKAKSISGMESDMAALMFIFRQFLSVHGSTRSIGELLAMLEAQGNVRFAAVDDEGEIIYGEQFLEEILSDDED